MKSQQKWEDDMKMKVHKNRIKQARNVRASPQTRDIQRKASYTALKSILKEYDLQNCFSVIIIQKLQAIITCSEDLLSINPSNIDSLISSLKLYPGQVHKFKKMLENLRTNSYKHRSATAIFPTLSPHHLKTESTEHRPRYTEQKLELNQKLKQDLIKAQEKITDLEIKIKKNAEMTISECKNNTQIDRNYIGKSFDSSRMRSTLHNMDIEEVCKCFARVIESQCAKKSNKVSPLIKEMNNAFVDESPGIPDESYIYNWCRTIISKGRLEKEVVVNAIVYLERYVEKSQVTLTSETWKKLVFTSMVLACKGNYVDKALYELYSEEEIERFERSFLTLIEHNLVIKQSEYAHAYFLMRTYASAKDKSKPVKFLQLEQVLELQKNGPQEPVKKSSLLKSM